MNDATKAATPALLPPAGVQPNFVDPPSLDSILITTVTLCLALSAVALTMRLYTKARVVQRLEIEDYAALCGIVMFAAYCAIMLLGSQAGAGRHMWDVSLEMLPGVLYYINVGQLFYGPIQWFAKATVLVQLAKLFAPTKRSAVWWAIQVNIWLNLVFYLADTVAIALQCMPREKIWHPWIEGGCIDIRAVRSGQSQTCNRVLTRHLELPADGRAEHGERLHHPPSAPRRDLAPQLAHQAQGGRLRRLRHGRVRLHSQHLPAGLHRQDLLPTRHDLRRSADGAMDVRHLQPSPPHIPPVP